MILLNPCVISLLHLGGFDGCANYHAALLAIRWSAWRKNLPRSSLTVSLYQLSDWSSMERSGLSLPAMRQSLCWTKLFTMSWMFGRRPEYRWISEQLCIQWNCPRLDFAAEIFCTVSLIFATGKAFSTQFSKQNLACKIWFARSNSSSHITPE